jgi:hypothetical protein
MPFYTTPNGTQYALIGFDADGRERTDDQDRVGGRFSARIIEDFSRDPTITDVFLLSHGWMGDVPAAIDQYNRWIGAMDARTADCDRIAQLRANFKPLRIGIHWPSKPWGEEELGAAGAAFSVLDDPIELYVERLGDRPGLRDAITIVVSEAAQHPDAEQLTPAAEKAYRDINNFMVELGASGEGAAPGSDREPFDPQNYFAAARQEASFGLADSLGGILAPLRQLSFWKMKQRARKVGESGLHAFLADLQQATAERDVRFHLMGHSFGCIVMSAMLCGPPSDARQVSAVASLALVQGALSLWSYCDNIPVAAGQTGYFRRLVEQKKVSGPILTTRSIFDTANGRFYPLGAGVANQVSFAPGELPRYGALGSFGVQGLVPDGTDMPMRAATEDYGFALGQIYNLEASQFVRTGSGPAGAHNDIAGPEVAHAIWQAALPVAARPG